MRALLIGGVAAIAASVMIAMSRPATERVATAESANSLDAAISPARNCCGTPTSRAAMFSKAKSERTQDAATSTRADAPESSDAPASESATIAVDRAIRTGRGSIARNPALPPEHHFRCELRSPIHELTHGFLCVTNAEIVAARARDTVSQQEAVHSEPIHDS